MTALVAAAHPAGAQRALGMGGDASTLPAGVMRVTVAGRWDRANERYDADGTLRPLGANASALSWNGAYDARLATATPLVSALSGLSGFDASLGTLAVGRRDNTADAPMGIELGVLSRLTVGASIRIASHGIEPDVRINARRVEGTMGFNPAWTNTTARDRNALLVAQFDSATAQTSRRIAQCQAAPAATGCAAIAANVSGAQSLVASATAFAAALNQLYGGRKNAAGLPFVPVSNGAAQQAITQRVLGFGDRFAAFGNSVISTQGPVGGALFSPTDVATLLTDTLYGYNLRPLRVVHAYGLGEVAVHAKLRLFQTIGDDTTTIRGFAVRQSVGATLRLSGGAAPAANEPIAPTAGEGGSGFSAQSFTDLWWGSRYAATIALGYSQGQAQAFAMRMPAATTPAVGGVPFPLVTADREFQLSRTPGSRIDIAITPRLALTRNIWMGASWSLSQQAADTWTVTAPSVPPVGATTPQADASAWAAGTDWSVQQLSLGGTYTTVDAVHRGRATLAFDVSYEHQQVSAGSGWRAAKATRDVVTVRWYPRLWGR